MGATLSGFGGSAGRAGSTALAGSACGEAAAAGRAGLAAATPSTNANVCSISWSRSRIQCFITHTPGPASISPEVEAKINGIARGADKIGATRDRLATACVHCDPALRPSVLNEDWLLLRKSPHRIATNSTIAFLFNSGVLQLGSKGLYKAVAI